jgi:hypothetical protein
MDVFVPKGTLVTHAWTCWMKFFFLKLQRNIYSTSYHCPYVHGLYHDRYFNVWILWSDKSFQGNEVVHNIFSCLKNNSVYIYFSTCIKASLVSEKISEVLASTCCAQLERTYFWFGVGLMVSAAWLTSAHIFLHCISTDVFSFMSLSVTHSKQERSILRYFWNPAKFLLNTTFLLFSRILTERLVQRRSSVLGLTGLWNKIFMLTRQ